MLLRFPKYCSNLGVGELIGNGDRLQDVVGNLLLPVTGLGFLRGDSRIEEALFWEPQQ